MSSFCFTDNKLTGYAYVNAGDLCGGDIRQWLTIKLRTAKRMYTPQQLAWEWANHTGGAVVEYARCSVLVTVAKSTVYVQTGEESTSHRVGHDRPMPNEIKDYRRRLPPFLPNGQCRG